MPPHGLEKVALWNNRVAVKNRTSAVPRYLHGNLLGNPRTDHVTDCRAAKVVHEKAFETTGFRCLAPTVEKPPLPYVKDQGRQALSALFDTQKNLPELLGQGKHPSLFGLRMLWPKANLAMVEVDVPPLESQCLPFPPARKVQEFDNVPNVFGQLGFQPLEVRRLHETLPSVVLAKTADSRDGRKPSRFLSQPKRPPKDSQLVVDRCRSRAFGLSPIDVAADAVGRDVDRPLEPKVSLESSNGPKGFIETPHPPDPVIFDHPLDEIPKSQSLLRGTDELTLGNLPKPKLEKLLCVGFLRRARTLAVEFAAVAVVNPPDATPAVDSAHPAHR
jgi:hypothetical protein